MFRPEWNIPIEGYIEIRCVYKVEDRAAFLCESLKDWCLVIIKWIDLMQLNSYER